MTEHDQVLYLQSVLSFIPFHLFGHLGLGIIPANGAAISAAATLFSWPRSVVAQVRAGTVFSDGLSADSQSC